MAFICHLQTLRISKTKLLIPFWALPLRTLRVSFRGRVTPPPPLPPILVPRVKVSCCHSVKACSFQCSSAATVPNGFLISMSSSRLTRLRRTLTGQSGYVRTPSRRISVIFISSLFQNASATSPAFSPLLIAPSMSTFTFSNTETLCAALYSAAASHRRLSC